MVAIEADHSVRNSYKEVADHLDHAKCWGDIKDEVRAISQKDAWTRVNLTPGWKTIATRWVYQANTNSVQNVERYKATLVANIFSQKVGVVFVETYAPLSKYGTLRWVLALVEHHRLKMPHVYFK